MKTTDSVTAIFKGLHKFRSQLKQPLKDKTNPFFKSKYVPLESVIQSIDLALENTGLSYFQEIDNNLIITIITHESGEYIALKGAEIKVMKQDPQAFGSALTYAKRYSLCTAFGISSDVDDDGMGAVYNQQKKQPSRPVNSHKPSERTIQEQFEAGIRTATDMGATMKQLMDWNGLKDKKEAINRIAEWIKNENTKEKGIEQ